MDFYNIYNFDNKYDKSSIDTILQEYLKSIDDKKAFKLNSLLNQITGDGSKDKINSKIVSIKVIDRTETDNKSSSQSSEINKKNNTNISKSFMTQFYSSESDL